MFTVNGDLLLFDWIIDNPSRTCNHLGYVAVKPQISLHLTCIWIVPQYNHNIKNPQSY